MHPPWCKHFSSLHYSLQWVLSNIQQLNREELPSVRRSNRCKPRSHGWTRNHIKIKNKTAFGCRKWWHALCYFFYLEKTSVRDSKKQKNVEMFVLKGKVSWSAGTENKLRAKRHSHRPLFRLQHHFFIVAFTVKLENVKGTTKIFISGLFLLSYCTSDVTKVKHFTADDKTALTLARDKYAAHLFEICVTWLFVMS